MTDTCQLLRKFFVFQLHFAGWMRTEREAANETEAMKADIRQRFRWLGDHPHRIVIDRGQFHVFYEGPGRRDISGLQKKGDYWFSGKIHIGQEDDCLKCAGLGNTDVDLYRQCFKCGDPNKKGKGTGKIKRKLHHRSGR